MNANTFHTSLLIFWVVLYIALPILLINRGWLFSGGLIQLMGAILPGIWQGIFWSKAAGNFGLLMLLLVPIPLCITVMGIYVSLSRAGKWFLATISANPHRESPPN